MQPTTKLVYYSPLEGVGPTAAREPWSVGTGSPSVTVVAAEDYAEVTGAGTYRVRVDPGKTVASIHVASRVEIQAAFRKPPAGSSSAVVLGIRDGARELLMRIGGGVDLIDSSATVIESLLADFEISGEVVAHFVKDGTCGWYASINGQLIGSIPYTAAPALVAAVATTWGVDDTGGIRFRYVEAGLNTVLPPERLVRRFRDSLPTTMLRAFYDTLVPHALTRTIVGLYASDTQALTDYPASRTSGEMRLARHQASGAGLPGDGNTLEVVGDVSRLSVVRQRIRVAAAATSGPDGVDGSWTAPAVSKPHLYAKTTVTMRALVAIADADDRVGPVLSIHHVHVFAAHLLGDGADDTYGWRLMRPSDNAVLGHVRWPVNPFVAHRVELHVFYPDVVFLYVDGVPVDWDYCSAWQDAGNTTADSRAEVSRLASGDIECEVDFEDIDLGASAHDLARRPGLLQRCTERMVVYGGCERNDVLEVLVRHRHGVHRARGSHNGILRELERLTCGAVDFYDDSRPLTWFYNVSYPGWTPVFFNAPGSVITRLYTITTGSKTFTPRALARWAAFHLLPRSTREMAYGIALKITTTSAFSGSTTSTASFASAPRVPLSVRIGDIVHVRNSSGLLPVVREVAAVSATSITVSPDVDGTTYATGSIVLVVLAHS